jgi:hypothetical protein
LLIVSTTGAFAASLKFSPHRINFDSKNRVFTLTVNNDTDAKKAYRLAFETRYLKPTGGTDIMSNDAELSAVPHLRLSPRRVILEPFGRQKIRLQYTGRDVEDGDYLAHLMFKEVNIPVARGDEAPEEDSTAGLKLEIKQAVNVAIPIRLSVGDVQRDVKILKAERNGYMNGDVEFLDINLQRKGNGNGIGFLYGRFKSNTDVDENNKTLPVVINRVPVNIYRNLNDFTLRAPISNDIALSNGKLILTLHNGEGINRPVLDTFVMDLP